MKYFCKKPHQSGVVNLLTYCSLPPPIHCFCLCSHFSIFTESAVSAAAGCSPQEWTFPRVADDGLQATAWRGRVQPTGEGKLL